MTMDKSPAFREAPNPSCHRRTPRTARSETLSIVAAEVTRLIFSGDFGVIQEPPYVDCAFNNSRLRRQSRLRTGVGSFICLWASVIGHVSLAVFLSAPVAVASESDAKDAPQPVSLEFQFPFPPENKTAPLRLRGKDAHQQLLVTAKLQDGSLADLTRKVSYSISPPKIVQVDKAGRVTALREGEATITARTPDGSSATLAVAVERINDVAPLNFPNQIVPIFTKAGCNSGGCHGKASGQNGFRLSLLGFEPAEDYEHLVKEARGRRIFPASPENSLLLLKATGTLPHGGGKRLDTDSDDYRLLVRWISQGMPYGHTNDPKVERIEVFPKERVMAMGAEQQLAVLAHYTDGTSLDVTRSALYEPNDKNIAKTDGNGLVTVFDQPGDVGVMVRYQGKVAVFRAMLPLGAPVESLPEPRNFIDSLVFAKLKKMGLPPSTNCDDATF